MIFRRGFRWDPKKQRERERERESVHQEGTAADPIEKVFFFIFIFHKILKFLISRVLPPFRPPLGTALDHHL